MPLMTEEKKKTHVPFWMSVNEVILFFMNGTLMLINIHFKSGQLLIYYINITLYFQF